MQCPHSQGKVGSGVKVHDGERPVNDGLNLLWSDSRRRESRFRHRDTLRGSQQEDAGATMLGTIHHTHFCKWEIPTGNKPEHRTPPTPYRPTTICPVIQPCGDIILIIILTLADTPRLHCTQNEDLRYQRARKRGTCKPQRKYCHRTSCCTDQ